jgi:hypothetical protein
LELKQETMNRTSYFPQACTLSKLLKFTLPLLLIAGMMACGGGSSSSNVGTGGGGGGTGASSPACTQPAPVVAGSTGKAAVNPEANAFTDLDMGSSSLDPTVPLGSLRLWDTGAQWPEVETSAGSFDFSRVNGFEQLASQNGWDLVYTLARTPNWAVAAANQNDTSCSYSSSTEGGPGQCDPPADLNLDGSGTDQTWINWVTAVALNNTTSQYGNTFGNNIKYYEIWNEWNVPVFWNPATTSVAQLVRMEQDARCVVEGPPSDLSCNSNSSFPQGTALDPSAKIITPSAVGAGLNSTVLASVGTHLNTYFTTTAAGSSSYGGAFADIIGFHGYVGTASQVESISPPCPVPENVTIVLGNLYSTVQANQSVSYTDGNPKPWFNTEDGWSEADYEGFLDPDRQAAFLARYFLLQWSMGVNRMYWYRWDSTSSYGGALWSQSGGPVEAVTAWQQVAAWMNGATISSCGPAGSGGVWSCTITRSGYQGLAVWDAADDCENGSCTYSTFNIPSGPSYKQYQDIAGNTTSLSGATSVQIGAKPILLETGPLP